MYIKDYLNTTDMAKC